MWETREACVPEALFLKMIPYNLIIILHPWNMTHTDTHKVYTVQCTYVTYQNKIIPFCREN